MTRSDTTPAAGFQGYASTFWTVDSYGTAFAPGCFARSLAEPEARFPCAATGIRHRGTATAATAASTTGPAARRRPGPGLPPSVGAPARLRPLRWATGACPRLWLYS